MNLFHQTINTNMPFKGTYYTFLTVLISHVFVRILLANALNLPNKMSSCVMPE